MPAEEDVPVLELSMEDADAQEESRPGTAERPPPSRTGPVQPAQLAGGFLAVAMLLEVSAFWAAPAEQRPFVRPLLATGAVTDGLLTAALLLGARWGTYAGWIRAATFFAIGVWLGAEWPLLCLLLVAASIGQLLLLVGTAGRRRAVLGASVLVFAAAMTGTLIFSPLLQHSPLERLGMELRGEVRPGDLTQALGASVDYRLQLPPGWRQLSQLPSGTATPAPDGAWVRPGPSARLVAHVAHLPGAGGASVAELEKAFREAVDAWGDADLTVLSNEAIDGPFDIARRYHLRVYRGGRIQEAYATQAAQGDVLVTISAVAPAHRFGSLALEFEAILDSLVWDPERPPQLRADVLARVKRSTGMVLTPEGSGSGVIIANAGSWVTYVATNDHVVRCANEAPCQDVTVVLPNASNDPVPYPAEIAFQDPESDLAILKVSTVGTHLLPALPLRHGEGLAERSPLFVVGYPFGLYMGGGKRIPSPTVNAGWLGGELSPEAKTRGRLPISAGINPGNSGGPVVDGAGRVLGLAVERLPGTETGLMISADTLARYVEYASRKDSPVLFRFDDAPMSEVALVEPLRSSDTDRLRPAIVAVRIGAQGTAGVVTGRLGDRAIVIAAADLSQHPRDGAPLKVEVKARPSSSDSEWEPAEVLRVNDAQGLLLLSVAGVPPDVEPLTPVRTRFLEQLSSLSVLSFRVKDGGELEQEHPEARWQHGSLASLQRDEKGEPEFLHADVGINHGSSGGAVLDAHGRLLGLAVARVDRTNLTLVIPGEMLSGFLRGGLNSGAWLFQRTSSGRCGVRVEAVVDDPLGTVKSVALRFGPDGSTWDLLANPRHAPALGDAPVIDMLVDGRKRVGLQAEVPCPFGSARVQLEVTDAEGAHRTGAARLPLVGQSPTELGGRVGGTWLLEGDPKDMLEFLLLPASPLPSWKGECLDDGEAACETHCRKGYGEACLALGLKQAANDPKRAATLFEIACGIGNIDGCAELAFLRVKSGSELLRGSTASKSLKRHCEEGNQRACFAADAKTFLKLVPQYEDSCQLIPSTCVTFGMAKLEGPGGVEANLARSLGAFRRACENGEREGCFVLALLAFEKGPAALEASKAVRHLETGCFSEQHAPSCLALASLHARGEGVPRELTRAREYARRACVLGHEAGCMIYGEDVAQVQ